MSDVAARPSPAPVSWAALLGLVGASLPMELDPAVHSIAVVGAGNALHMSGSDRTLAASIGTLCIAAAILATGSLGDRLGRRRIMLLGLATTLVGGLVTAFANGTAMFALGRALSGVGFAASFGLSFALLRTIAPQPEALARTVARWLALQTGGVVVLCLVGGYLAGVSWRAAYLVGPAVGMVALLWCLRAVPEAKDEAAGRLDAPGLALVALGLVGTLYGISNAASAGWASASVVVPLVLGFVLLAAFALWEWRCDQPAFPIRAFVAPELMAGALGTIGFNIANAVVTIQLSLLWQYVYRYKPFEVSLAQLPMIAACILAAGWAGGLVARGVSMRLLLPAGLLVMAGALASVAFAGERTPYLLFVLPLVAVGTGLMLTQAPAANVFVARAPAALVGAMGSSRTAFGQFSYALGISVSSSLLYGMFSPLLRERLHEAGATPLQQTQSAGILQSYIRSGDMQRFDAALVQEVIASATAAYLESFRTTMLVMAGLVAAIAALCFWILSRRASRPSDATLP